MDTAKNRDSSKPAEQQGVFKKFEVLRMDGSHLPGRKHEGCNYFVLDLTCDPHAKAAMLAYAEACKETHPVLSAEIFEQFKAQDPLSKLTADGWWEAVGDP